MGEKGAATGLKVVAHRHDGSLVKGFTAGVPEFYERSLQSPATLALPPESLGLRLAENGHQVEVPIEQLKALFFVKSFTGSTDYNEIKFFKAHPLQEGLWVRLRFRDGENTEGVVFNGIQFVIGPGFFLKPPDPHSNNEIVYVLKSSLDEFRVLGVRNHY